MIRFFKKRKTTPNLTEGNILNNIFILALPLLVRAVLESFQSVIDMFWVGRLGPQALAGVAMGGTIVMVLFPLLIGIGTGTTVMVARSIGAKNQEAADNAATQSIIIALITAGILCLVGILFSHELLKLLQASPEVILIGERYLKVILLGGVAMTMLFLSGSILQGAGDAVTPMKIMSLSVVANIILDPFLIFGWLGLPALGVRGAALATVIAEGSGSFFLLYILFKGKSNIHIRFDKYKINFAAIAQIFKIGIPSSMQMLFRHLMNLVLMAIVATYGTYAVAAYGIGLRLRMMFLLPAFSFGAAAATLVGQNLGAKQPDRAHRTAWLATLINAAIMTAIGLLLFIFSENVIGLFNKNPEVIFIGVKYLKITSLFFPAIAFGVVFGRAINGAGDTIPPMIITFITLWLIQIPLAVILPKYTILGLDGIWWAISIATLIQGILALVWFERGSWKLKKVHLYT
jgi:putative MATE family efflux protein